VGKSERKGRRGLGGSILPKKKPRTVKSTFVFLSTQKKKTQGGGKEVRQHLRKIGETHGSVNWGSNEEISAKLLDRRNQITTFGKLQAARDRKKNAGASKRRTVSQTGQKVR